MKILFLILLYLAKLLRAETVQTDNFKKAEKAFNEGKFSLAEIYYKKVLEKEPDNFKANYNLGKIYFYNSKYDDAIKFLSTAYDLKPSKEIKFLIACSYIANNQIEKGISIYSNLLKEAPDYADAHLNLGIINLKYLLNKERTIYHWTEFLKLRPNDKQAPAIRKALEYLQDPNFVLNPSEKKTGVIKAGEEIQQDTEQISTNQQFLPIIIKGKDIKLDSEEKYKLKNKKSITTEWSPKKSLN